MFWGEWEAGGRYRVARVCREISKSPFCPVDFQLNMPAQFFFLALKMILGGVMGGGVPPPQKEKKLGVGPGEKCPLARGKLTLKKILIFSINRPLPPKASENTFADVIIYYCFILTLFRPAANGVVLSKKKIPCPQWTMGWWYTGSTLWGKFGLFFRIGLG